jgi:prophage antirepressor-like protein
MVSWLVVPLFYSMLKERLWRFSFIINDGGLWFIRKQKAEMIDNRRHVDIIMRHDQKEHKDTVDTGTVQAKRAQQVF